MDTPLTMMWRIPEGASAVRRSPSAGKSWTRRSGPGATVSGSNTHTSARFAHLEGASVGQAVDAGRLAGQLVDRPLQGHDLPVAHPVAQQVGCKTGIAQLRDVSPRVGQAQQEAVPGEEPGDPVVIAVG